MTKSKPKASKGTGNPIPRVEIATGLSAEQGEALLRTLQDRFEQNMHRHEGIEWAQVQAKLEERVEKLASLNAMESTGGEPDVVGYDSKTDEYLFFDCSTESPAGRRSICYDREGQQEREKKGIQPSRECY